MEKCDNKGNHFFVEIIPSIDDRGDWDGKFQLAIQIRRANISDDSFFELENLCQMACASLTLMEEDTKFKDKVDVFLHTPDDEDIKPSLPIDNVTENVIKVNFERKIGKNENNKC